MQSKLLKVAYKIKWDLNTLRMAYGTFQVLKKNGTLYIDFILLDTNQNAILLTNLF